MNTTRPVVLTLWAASWKSSSPKHAHEHLVWDASLSQFFTVLSLFRTRRETRIWIRTHFGHGPIKNLAELRAFDPNWSKPFPVKVSVSISTLP